LFYTTTTGCVLFENEVKTNIQATDLYVKNRIGCVWRGRTFALIFAKIISRTCEFLDKTFVRCRRGRLRAIRPSYVVPIPEAIDWFPRGSVLRLIILPTLTFTKPRANPSRVLERKPLFFVCFYIVIRKRKTIITRPSGSVKNVSRGPGTPAPYQH